MADFAGVLAATAVFGAFAGREIVGVVRLAREPGPKEAHKGRVGGFFVRPEWRRQGGGVALMAARALCRRFGFLTYGVEPRARKEGRGYSDMVLMALRLDAD